MFDYCKMFLIPFVKVQINILTEILVCAASFKLRTIELSITREMLLYKLAVDDIICRTATLLPPDFVTFLLKSYISNRLWALPISLGSRESLTLIYETQ